MNESKAAMIAYLQTCNGRELMDILFQVFQARPENDHRGGYQEKLVVGIATRSEATEFPADKAWENWDLRLIAPVDPSQYEPKFLEYDSETEEFFSQSGECSACKVGVCSSLKNGLCPLCGKKVYMT